MHFSNNILSSLDVDTTDFFFSKKVVLYDDVKKNPYGKITIKQGKYHLTVGDINMFDDPDAKYAQS
jgi:hypothetical protein